MKTIEYKVTLVNDTYKKSFIISESQLWLSKGNFSGMGNFTKVKIKKINNG